MLCSRLLRIRYFAAIPKANVEQESHMLIDPHFFQKKDLISKAQHWLANNEALNDIERSFKQFKRTECAGKYLIQYNNLSDWLKRQKFNEMETILSPTLFKELKKANKNKQELPYYLPEATACELMQARGYSQNIMKVKSTNKWYQLTFKYTLIDGEIAYHVMERNDKLKNFSFIKFYL